MSRTARARRTWWLMYAIGVVTVFGALITVTNIIVSFDLESQRATQHNSQQELMRLALWRLDSWLSPLIGQEAARPHFVYQSYYSKAEDLQGGADPNATSGGSRRRSPLAFFDSELVALHFQIDGSGHLVSPEIPPDDEIGRREESSIRQSILEDRRRSFATLESSIQPYVFASQVVWAESCFDAVLSSDDEPAEVAGSQSLADDVSERTRGQASDRDSLSTAQLDKSTRQSIDSSKLAQLEDRKKRADITQQNMANSLPQQTQSSQQSIPYAPMQEALQPDIEVGRFVPLWLTSKDDHASGRAQEHLLTFVRRVQLNGDEIQQGFLLRWSALTEAMLSQIDDLGLQGRIVPAYDEWSSGEPPDFSLAVMPAILEVLANTDAHYSISTPTRATLFLSWGAMLIAVCAVGLGLRGGIRYGEKRSRFASAVTHELRTPLTTFRMYSEMLSHDMVPADQQGAYFQTLDHEARRLESLVNNVLAYARLEEGRYTLDQSNAIAANELLVRIAPTLLERVRRADMQLVESCDNPEKCSPQVCTDADAVGQILFNLVENACKYGFSTERPEVYVHLSHDPQSQWLWIDVGDNGAGIGTATVRRLFEPFERGDNENEKPGIGLGLALSRGLAHDLGGDLQYLPAEVVRAHPILGECSTVFRLQLPI